VDSGPADVLALLAAPDFVSEGDVVVAAFGGHQGCAAAGDRVTGALRQAGAIGLVTDGPVRDYEGIVEVGLPVFCTGLTPASPYSSGPGTIGGPVLIGGQRVETGDMIVADRTGVVVVPHEMLDTVLDALEKIKVMEEVRDRAVAEGVLVPANVRKILDGPRTRRLS
jgi:regulator of RNase E activity RraA